MARGDKLIQIKDARLYDAIERRRDESGAANMAEVVRRVMEVALLIDEINYPPERESLEQQQRRVARLRTLLASSIDVLAQFGQLPASASLALNRSAHTQPNLSGGSTLAAPAELPDIDDDDDLSGAIE